MGLREPDSFAKTVDNVHTSHRVHKRGGEKKHIEFCKLLDMCFCENK